MDIRKVLIGVVAAMPLLFAGCSGGINNGGSAVEGSTQRVEEGSQHATAETAEEQHSVELDHLRLQVAPDWIVEQGADSAAFHSNDQQPLGGIDGLGYAESVESLVPNHTIVKEQKELDGFPVKAFEVITESDAQDDPSSETIHIYLLLEQQKVVYDIHFDAKSITNEQALEIVKTAEIL